MTRAGSSTNDVSIRASYQPVSQSAAASSWLRPSCFASAWMFAIDTPNALAAVMPNRAVVAVVLGAFLLEPRERGPHIGIDGS